MNPARSRSISSNGSNPGEFPPRNAIGDYAYLRDRGYSSRPAVSLVGDRYRLTRRQRTILYRGVCSEEEARRRESRLALPAAAARSSLTVDGYNVLLILYHYLTGYPVFLCRDGLVRDAGLSRGRSARPEKLAQVVRSLVATFETAPDPPKTVRIILDEAMSHSRDHAGILRSIWAEAGSDAAQSGADTKNRLPRLEVRLSPGADAEIAAADEGFLATSDSQVIDRSRLPVIDLPRWILEERFGVSPAGL